MTNKTFCILPFVHMQIKPSGQMKPCCRFDFHNPEYIKDGKYLFNEFNVADTSLTAGQNSELWQDIRNKMLAGESVAGCHKCYKEEDITSHSMRTYENSLRNKNDQEQLVDKELASPKIQYLEMTFGNYCNLKCRTCNADLSSTWWEDENALVETGKYPDRKHYPKTVNIPFNWKPEDFKDVEEIKFTGGEPMVHPDFIKLMDMLIEIDVAKNIKLDIFTNCSWIPGEKYLDRLRQFKKIVLSLSVDGIGSVNEYIRSPSSWPTVDKAVDSWLALEKENRENIHVVWNPTINIYNIMSLGKMIRWWFDKNANISKEWMELTILCNRKMKESEIVPAGKMKLNILHFPNYLSVELLPQINRTTVARELNDIRRELIDSKEKIINKFIIGELSDNVKDVVFNSSLPPEIKNIVASDFSKYLTGYNDLKEHWFIKELRYKISKVVDILDEKFIRDEDRQAVFINYTRDLDKLRNEKIDQAIPELYEVFKKWFDRHE